MRWAIRRDERFLKRLRGAARSTGPPYPPPARVGRAVALMHYQPGAVPLCPFVVGT
jgi:hypothetical protein